MGGVEEPERVSPFLEWDDKKGGLVPVPRRRRAKRRLKKRPQSPKKPRKRPGGQLQLDVSD